MLVLKRKVDECVVIEVPPSTEPQTITVMVVELPRGRARLGFCAAKDVVIHREEVAKRIEAEKVAAGLR